VKRGCGTGGLAHCNGVTRQNKKKAVRRLTHTCNDGSRVSLSVTCHVPRRSTKYICSWSSGTYDVHRTLHEHGNPEITWKSYKFSSKVFVVPSLNCMATSLKSSAPGVFFSRAASDRNSQIERTGCWFINQEKRFSRMMAGLIRSSGGRIGSAKHVGVGLFVRTISSNPLFRLEVCISTAKAWSHVDLGPG
jgi:hypothetical protein